MRELVLVFLQPFIIPMYSLSMTATNVSFYAPLTKNNTALLSPNVTPQPTPFDKILGSSVDRV